MTKSCSWVLILLAVGLMVVADSLTAGSVNDQSPGALSTTGGGTMSPVKESAATPIDVIGEAPVEAANVTPPDPVQSPDIKPYTKKAPVEPDAVIAQVEDDDQCVSLTGVTKIALYLDKQPPLSRGVAADGEAIPDEEMPSPVMDDAYRVLANPYLISSGSVNSPIPDQGWHWRRVRDSTQAPAGAVVTNLEYRLRITHHGDPSTFYCGDYEIHLFTGSAARELMVYDNLGGRTDGDFDDDTEDDADIYLNWRPTSFFNGDDARDWFGVSIDDVYASDSGLLNYIEFYVHWSIPLPNLTCHAPSGWDSAIVASAVVGTNTADSLTGGEPAYIDWSVINDGGADVVGRFYTALYIDGNYITQWFTDDLGANWWTWVHDFAQTLDTGDHSICIVADHTGVIAEENENDNDCCFTYHWYPMPLDSDGDGWADPTDNCLWVYNPDQSITISLTGDANEDGLLNSADLIALVNYVFKSGLPPIPCPAVGDANCDDAVTASDIIYLVAHVFKGGPPPLDVCLEPGLSWLCQ